MATIADLYDVKSGDIMCSVWNKTNKKWVVRINVNGKRKSFGTYNDIDYAKFVADAMRHKYHGNVARNI